MKLTLKVNLSNLWIQALKTVILPEIVNKIFVQIHSRKINTKSLILKILILFNKVTHLKSHRIPVQKTPVTKI